VTAPGSILVVDDDPINRRLLARTLTAQGHDVVTAEDGREALDVLRAEAPDIVLLDVVMPEMDGVTALERIKRDPALRSTPVIMVSALEDFASVVRCIELGAEDYLQKPFNPVLLRARVNAGLDKRRLQQLERARVRDVFARFLPETVVEEVLSHADGRLRLGGVRVVGTVLFADLRSFTTFAERTPPDRVIAVLNRFLGEMSDAVLDNGGTLVAFLGDGLMAVFGAPIAYDDHADRAVAAAREMMRVRLPRFNAWAVEQGYADGFRMGVGMCSGPLMSGNVGSERRLEYTAIGDTVNTASRIESLTKELGCPVLISQSTRDLVETPSDDLEFVEEVKIRGRSAPTRLWRLAAATLAALALGLIGCGGDSPQDTATTAQGADPSTDKLAQINARGTLVLFTDPGYPPQSFKAKGAGRTADTKCAANELTAPEMAGYDADTGKLVAAKLGVEPCFVTPSWTEVTAGNWGDRWDLAYGSGAIEFSRMEGLYMTQPYYSTPANFFVPKSSKARTPEDLSGKRVGACAGCTMELYLRGKLKVPGPKLSHLVDHPHIVTFDTEVPGLKATANRKVDGFLCSEPVGAEAIAKGAALRMLARPAYYSNKTGYVDRKSGLEVASFVNRVNEIVAGLHADGTLAKLSLKYFGKDYAANAAEFDLSAIGQSVH